MTQEKSKILERIERFVLSRRSRFPLILGVSGAQGIGKTTLCREMVESLARQGIRAVSISIDDFYLTRAEQDALGAAHPQNPYLQQRGYPGTHDLNLGLRILQGLKNLKVGETLQIPQYDKSTFHGKGDRMPLSNWKWIEGPVEVILFDGWMLGFLPVTEEGLDASMKEINGMLAAYSLWWKLIDAWLFLEPEDLQSVISWRMEAELRMVQAGKEGMTQEEVKAYILKFLPAYRVFLPGFSAFFDQFLRNDGLRFRISNDRHGTEK